jgi:uncharacterized membrane protein
VISLIFATLFFVGIHLFISGTTMRDRITEVIGELPYMGLFSLASLIGISWMCMAYTDAPTIALWAEPPGTRVLGLLITLPAFLLIGIGFTTPSPTAAGGEKLLQGDTPCQGILRVSRHPGMWGIGIWAAFHAVANGDAASLIFFAGLMTLALMGARSIDQKRERKLGADWQAFAAVSSRVPFAAIVQGRNQFVLSEIGTWRIGVSLLIWAGALALHAWLFGSSPLPF